MSLETFGGRKFLLALGCGVATTFLQYMGKLDPDGGTFAWVVLGTVGGYITGNVLRKKIETKA